MSKGHIMDAREDDKFMRKMIWFIAGLALTSAASIVAMQMQINENAKAVKEIKKLQITMTSIQIGVARLVENSVIRNDMMKAEKTQQDYIFGEQKRRLPIIKRSRRHMDNRGIHR